jgi:phage baseplate assembly protein W
MTSRAPVDFGTDLSCTDDLDPAMAEVSGITLLAQAIYRRLTTPRGALWEDPDYGFDVRELLSSTMTPAQIASIPGQVRTEVQKDERIQSADVRVMRTTALELEIGITCVTELGPFSLVLSVTAAAVALSSVTPT